jgi:photosystem II stability/assembly factor-like uncharacterized protein
MNNLIKLLFLFIILFSFASVSKGGWVQQTSGTTTGLLSIHMLDQNTGYISGANGILRKTTNGGTNWTALTSGVSDSLHCIFFSNVNTGYVVGSNGVIRKTTNGGLSWVAQASGTTNTLKSMKFVGSDIGFVVGYSGRVLKTTNGGTNWFNLVTGGTGNLWGVDFINQMTGSVSSMNGVVYRTVNGGLNWQAYNFGSQVELGCIKYLDNQNLIAGLGMPGTNEIAVSSNGGANWQYQNIAPTAYSIRNISFPSRRIGYMSGDAGSLFRTIDSGRTWTGQTVGGSVWHYGCSFINDTTGWIVGTFGSIYKTTDGGSLIPTAPSNLVGFQSDVRKVYLSWFDNSNNEDGFKIERSFNTPNNFQVIKTLPANTIVYTDTTVETWTTYFYRVNSFNGFQNSSYSNVVMVAVTNAGNTSTVVPDKYSLHQNYPNPFNPETTIKFELKNSVPVTLKIINTLGKEVMTLLDGVKFGAGTYLYNLNMSKLESGVYFYKLHTPEFTDIKKMTLIK